jgi:hypothetical protein
VEGFDERKRKQGKLENKNRVGGSLRKEPLFECPKCRAKQTKMIEIGVNCDVINLKEELLNTIGEEPGFFFCPECEKEVTRELGWNCDLSTTEREREAITDRDVFACPSCRRELKHLIRIGVYRDVLWSGGLLTCLDDKLRIVLCPECKANITSSYCHWLESKRSELDALNSLVTLFEQSSPPP